MDGSDICPRRNFLNPRIIGVRENACCRAGQPSFTGEPIEIETATESQGVSPGVNPHTGGGGRSYLTGLGIALVLTMASFWASSSSLVYDPGILRLLAIAQMGVHLVFFPHISSAPDQTNNVLALAFGIFVVGLTVFGSMIIMSHLNHEMMTFDHIMQIQRWLAKISA